MRRRKPLRESRLAQVGVGATIIAIPATATTLAEAATTHPAAAGTTGSALQVRLGARRIEYGHDVVVTGRVPASDAGQTVTLDFLPAGAPTWSSLASAPVRPDGRFRVATPLRRSGAITVSGSWQSQPPANPTPSAAAADSAGSSSPQHVTVGAQLRLAPHAFAAQGQGMLTVRGKLVPGTTGRRLRLQALHAGRWQTLSSGRTGRHGNFVLRFPATGSGPERLRVLFGGDRLNGRTARYAGTARFFTPGVASWYSDGGSTACGFHAYYGVANVSLPCGTRVALRYGGRSVTAVVDDRGPYVGGREWDLNQNTAAALGFGGVDTVWSSPA